MTYFLLAAFSYLVAAKLFLLAWWKLMPSFYDTTRDEYYVLGWRDITYSYSIYGGRTQNGVYSIQYSFWIAMCFWWFITGYLIVKHVGMVVLDGMVVGYIPYNVISRRGLPNCSLHQKHAAHRRFLKDVAEELEIRQNK